MKFIYAFLPNICLFLRNFAVEFSNYLIKYGGVVEPPPLLKMPICLTDRNFYRLCALLLCLLFLGTSPAGAKRKAVADSVGGAQIGVDFQPNSDDSLKMVKAAKKAAADSALHRIPAKSKDAISSPIKYTSKDSAVFYTGGVAFLYGSAEVNYEDLTLKSSVIRLRMDSNLVQARGRIDSTGELVETPVFSQGNDTYESEAIDYNFKSQKGLIRGVVTQQGEGYVTSDKAKKLADGTFQMVDGKYTTCDMHEHPHFYLDLTKAKVRPKEYVVTGPAYLVLLDVPIPLFIPFGYFPFTESYSSGLLMPSYGYDSQRGYYLRNGGYYLAINDYIDLALRGDVYTKGSWGLNAVSRYKKRYKYSGNFNVSYQKTIYGEEPNLPDYSEMRDMKIMWTHVQDAKANPFSTLSASVNFSSSAYNKNNVDSYYNPAYYSENNKSSSINYQLNIPNTTMSLASNATLNQRTADSTISLSLPNIYFNASRMYPFKRKSQVGKDRWYEKLYVGYNFNFNNTYHTKENEFSVGDIFSKGSNGIKHAFTTGASYTLFKYFVLSPSVSYRERWYFRKYNQTFDENKQVVKEDTVKGFYRVYDVSTNLDLSTQLYGFYKPLNFMGGKKISMIRHVLTPTVGFSWVPVIDNNNTSFYYRTVPVTGALDRVDYSHFHNAIFGTTTTEDQGNVNLGVNNNVEMKVVSDKDSTGFRKISLIDNLSANTSYNIFADSLNWSDISSTLRLKLTKQVSLNVNASFTPYTYRLNQYGNPTKVNVTEWEKNHRIARMRSASTSFGYTFSNSMFKKGGKNDATLNENNSIDGFDEDKEDDNTPSLRKNKKQKDNTDAQGYEKFSLPWHFRIDYSVSYADKNFNKRKMTFDQEIDQSLNFSGNVQFSKNWEVSFSSGYDFTEKEISYTSFNITRNMHCWYSSLNLVPFGDTFSYSFHIGVRSSMLQDLKYEQRRNRTDFPVWSEDW